MADLGKLTVNNTFPRDGDKGTLNHEIYKIKEAEMIPTHKSLLDCISVRLKDMDIWTATRVSDGENGECSFKKDEKSLLVKLVLLDLKVERNL